MKRKAIGAHSTATAKGAWDGPANEANLKTGQPASYYRAAFAWVDPAGDPTTKAAYKFIHHLVDDGGTVGAAAMMACSAGIAVMNGGRGGTTIPAADRQGVWDHLAKHLRDAGMEPPPLRSSALAIERRFCEEIKQLEVREGTDGKPRTIVGYPIVFDQQTLIQGWFGAHLEQVAKTAFTKTIKEHDIRALFNHDPNMVLGRTTSGTLKLRADDYGVYMEVEPPDTQWANDLVTSIKRGDVSGGSFAVRIIKDSWTDGQQNADGSTTPRLRTIEEGVLYDVSPVTYPAYPQTDIQARCAHCGASPYYAEPLEPEHSEDDDPAEPPEPRRTASPELLRREWELLAL